MVTAALKHYQPTSRPNIRYRLYQILESISERYRYHRGPAGKDELKKCKIVLVITSYFLFAAYSSRVS